MKNINNNQSENFVKENTQQQNAVKISKTKYAALLLFLMVSLSSCDAIAGIFKAGMGVGIFMVIAVIIIIVLIVRSMAKK